MSDLFNRWLSHSTKPAGTFGCGVVYPNEGIFVQSYSNAMTEELLQTACKRIGEMVNVVGSQSIEGSRLRWVFNEALCHVAVRSDGICLVVFTRTDFGDGVEFRRWGAEFRAL